jgi:Flp pilus assembly protein TadD
MRRASAVVHEGIEAGIDPGALYPTLAWAARNAGDRDLQGSALESLVECEPTYEHYLLLGEFQFRSGDYGPAAATLRRAIRLNPGDARAWAALARVEERGYEYAAADRDYLRACSLAPNDATLKEGYARFRSRIAAAARAASK